MISKVVVNDPDYTCVHWYPKTMLKKIGEFEFTDGLNIVFGPNGCGKSTLLKLISTMFMCEIGGVPTIGEMSLHKFVDNTKNSIINWKFPSGVEYVHDGQPIFKYSPEKNQEEHYQTDWDNVQMVVNDKMSADLSSGQKVLRDLQVILGHACDLEAVKEATHSMNSLWTERADGIKDVILNGTIQQGKRTVLMDEPDRSLDLPAQLKIWKYLENEWSDTFQIIVATHNPMALSVDANFIDVVPGYVEECRKCLEIKRKKEFKLKRR